MKKEFSQLASPETYVEHSDIVTTVAIAERIMILVGLDKTSGLNCLKNAAVKIGLLTEDESKTIAQYFKEEKTNAAIA